MSETDRCGVYKERWVEGTFDSRSRPVMIEPHRRIICDMRPPQGFGFEENLGEGYHSLGKVRLDHPTTCRTYHNKRCW